VIAATHVPAYHSAASPAATCRLEHSTDYMLWTAATSWERRLEHSSLLHLRSRLHRPAEHASRS